VKLVASSFVKPLETAFLAQLRKDVELIKMLSNAFPKSLSGSAGINTLLSQSIAF